VIARQRASHAFRPVRWPRRTTTRCFTRISSTQSGTDLNRDGEEEVPGEYVYNGSVANKALEPLGKELGMFNRKEVGGPNEFARMSDEELDACLRESIEPLSLLHNGRSKH